MWDIISFFAAPFIFFREIRAIYGEHGLKEKSQAFFAARRAYVEALVAGKDGEEEMDAALDAYERLLIGIQKTVRDLKREGLPPQVLLDSMIKNGKEF